MKQFISVTRKQGTGICIFSLPERCIRLLLVLLPIVIFIVIKIVGYSHKCIAMNPVVMLGFYLFFKAHFDREDDNNLLPRQLRSTHLHTLSCLESKVRTLNGH